MRMDSVIQELPRAFARQAPNILVVDDDDIICDVLSELLQEALGYNVTCALSAEEALARLEVDPYDVVLTDVVMPGMNGLELAKIVRRQFPKTQVILSTGHAPTSILEDMQPYRVLLKPYGLDDLKQTLHHAVA